MKNNYASIDKALNIDSDIVEVDKERSAVEIVEEKAGSQQLSPRNSTSVSGSPKR